MATTTKAKASTHVLDVNASQLHRVLHNAALFTDKGGTVPALTGVRVECDGKRLLAVATDRFVMGCSWVDLDGKATDGTAHDDVGCSFNLSPDDVDKIIKVSKTRVGDAATRVASIIQNYDGTIEFKFWTGESFIVRHFDHEFPSWRRLIPDTEAEVARTAFGFTQPYLAKFGKVISDVPSHQLAVFSFDAEHDASQRKPFAVRLGEHFVGIIMPVRLNESCRWRKPEWMA